MMPLQRFDEALRNVPDEYFGDTERLFSYELYHQLRMVFSNNPFPYENIVIDAELPKRVLGQQQAQELGLLPLENLMAPDFIIHERDTGYHQLLVAEVKAQRYLNEDKTITDINKLISLRKNYNFGIGIFVAINVSMDRIIHHINDQQNEIMWPEINGIREIDLTLDIHIYTKLSHDRLWEHDTLINIINNL